MTFLEKDQIPAQYFAHDDNFSKDSDDILFLDP
jgi:hypothetical protein